MKYTVDEIREIIDDPFISSIDSNYIKELIEIEYTEKLNKFYNKYCRKEE